MHCMKILLINHYAGSQNMGMEFRPYYLAGEWKRLGVDVKIVAGSYSHVRKEQPKALGSEQIDGIDYLWLWTNKYKGNGLMRFIGMIIFMLQLFIKIPMLAYRVRPDVVIASSTYPLDILPSFIIAKLSGAKLVFEIHDLWPLSPIELGGMSKWHPFTLVMRFAEWFAYKEADKIISILPATYPHVALDGVKKENFLHIPNGVVEGHKGSHDKSLPIFATFAKLKAKGHKVVAYTGSIGIANNLDTLLQAAQMLEDEPVSFVIIGDGPERARLEALGGKNIIFAGPVPKDEIIHVLKAADFAYLGLKKQPLYRFGTSQNKLYDYMLAAKPIIQAIEAEGDPVKEAKCGFSIAAEDPKVLAKTIRLALATPTKELEAMGARGRDYVLKHHNYKTLAKKFLEFIS